MANGMCSCSCLKFRTSNARAPSRGPVMEGSSMRTGSRHLIFPSWRNLYCGPLSWETKLRLRYGIKRERHWHISLNSLYDDCRICLAIVNGCLQIAFAGSIMEKVSPVRNALIVAVQREFGHVRTLAGVVDPIAGAVWRARHQ